MAGLLRDPEAEGVHEGDLKEFNQRRIEQRNLQAGLVSASGPKTVLRTCKYVTKFLFLS